MLTSKALVALLFSTAVTAMAQDQGPRTLNGAYAVSTSAVCNNSSATLVPVYVPPLGFTANFAPIGHASSNSFSTNGVAVFNEDGTGSQSARTVSIGDPDPGDSGATNALDTSSDFTYTIGDDGTLTITQGPLTGVFVAGPRAGQRTQTTNIPSSVGRVSVNKGALVFGSFDPGVETNTNLETGLVESVRICHRSSTAIRIGE